MIPPTPLRRRRAVTSVRPAWAAADSHLRASIQL